MKKLKKVTSFTILVFLVLNIFIVKVNAINYDKFKVAAKSAIAIERESGKILFEQNAFELLPVASTTKILTALVALENGDLDDKFQISKNAAAVRGSKVGYKAGEEIKLRELLYGLMYKSGNDAAIAIAEGIGGSIDGFSVMMNHFSKGLGVIDSHFQTPHGLDKEDHYSSAYDLGILTSKAMEYKVFREIVGTKSINKYKYNFTRDYNNINKILWKIPNANGVKTGYTGGAGKCLVSSVKYSNKDIIIVVLNCSDRWNVTEKIFNHIKGEYAFKDNNKILAKDDDKHAFSILNKEEGMTTAFTQDDTQYEVDVFNRYKKDTTDF